MLIATLLTGVPVIILLILQWRLIGQLRTASTDVVQQAVDDSAEVLAQQIRHDFGWPAFNLLERIDHRDVRDLRFAGIAKTLAERASHLEFIDRVFIWSKDQTAPIAIPGCDLPSTQVYFFTVRSDNGEEPRYPVRCNPPLSAAIRAKGVELAGLRNSFTLSEETVDQERYHTVYHYLFDQTEQRLGLAAFVGFTVNQRDLTAHYFPRAVAAAIGRVRQSTQYSIPALAMSIIDDRGQEVYRSGRSLFANYDGEARFPFLFFNTDLLESLGPAPPPIRYWTVRTGFVEGNISGFVLRQTRLQQVLWLVIVLVALVGVGLTVRATIREARVVQLQSEFMSSVSHDLKTPLAKIQLFAETLESGRARSPEKAQEYYSIIRSQSLKLGHMIGTMLEFAKIQAGARQYQLEEIDFVPVVRSALAAFEDELTLKNFEVETSFPDHEVPIHGNSDGLQQLLDNLISNAIKYSSEVRYLFVGVAIDGSHATVEIADRGIGIPRSEQRRIFRKFYRVRSDAAHPATTGSGLGLSIVTHVARAHAATISVDSERGRGSSFKVRLPLIAAEAART